jgi:septal ring factor EnvC (AmiA/AmiB activator)
MDWAAWKKALELYMSTPELIAASVVIVIAVFAFSWWLRGHIVRERIAAKDQQLNLARSQRDDLDAKLAEGKTKITQLESQIAAKASTVELSANVGSTAALFGDMQIISDNMRVTLGPVAGVVVFRGRSDEPQD